MMLRSRPVASSTADGIQPLADRRQPVVAAAAASTTTTTTTARAKRKADFHDNNERLSKRLSLLNIEQNGTKLYVPVEKPRAPPSSPVSPVTAAAAAAPATAAAPRRSSRGAKAPDSDTMQLDDSKHKVYIYNIDDELSSESEPEDGKLVFLPNIEKHLRLNRIPPSVLPNKDGELAGMQMVLYREPTSLTVPEEQDSVRKAIIEARARLRDRQKEEREASTSVASSSSSSSSSRAPTAHTRKTNAAAPTQAAFPMQVDDPLRNSWVTEPAAAAGDDTDADDDGEAMDLD